MKFSLLYIPTLLIIVLSLQNSYAGGASPDTTSKTSQDKEQSKTSIFNMLSTLYNDFATQQTTQQAVQQSRDTASSSEPSLLSRIIDSYRQMQLQQQAKPDSTTSYGVQTTPDQQKQDLSSYLEQALTHYLGGQSDKQNQYSQQQKDTQQTLELHQPSLLSRILSQLSDVK